MEQLAIAIRLRVGFQRWQEAYSPPRTPMWMRPADKRDLREFFARVYGPDQTAWR